MTCVEPEVSSYWVFRAHEDLLSAAIPVTGKSPAAALIDRCQRAAFSYLGVIDACSVEDAFDPRVPLEGGARCRLGDVLCGVDGSFICAPVGIIPVPGVHDRLCLMAGLFSPFQLSDIQ